jgi:Fe-S-cluster containining protein
VAALVDMGLQAHIGFDHLQSTAPQVLSWARREHEGSVFHQVFPTLVRDTTATCTLLDGERNCSVYPHWPLSCARYPYALDVKYGVVFYAKGCTSTTTLPYPQATAKQRALVQAVVNAYNERIKDMVLLALCRAELSALGLTAHLRTAQLPF